MIGIVIVSHSAKLAEGVRELADQMTKGRVPLAVSGGIEDPQHPIGTDALDVHKAIESVYSDDGVVVLMDLGSALLSAETALEFLSEAQRGRIRLCEAPLVEGAVAAAVQAMVSNDIELVSPKPGEHLAAKTAQLKATAPDMTVPCRSNHYDRGTEDTLDCLQPARSACAAGGTVCQHRRSLSGPDQHSKPLTRHGICQCQEHKPGGYPGCSRGTRDCHYRGRRRCPGGPEST